MAFLESENKRLEAAAAEAAGEAQKEVLAAKDGDRLHLVRETADLWFHCLVMLSHYGLGPGDILAELQRREGISGIDEKAARGTIAAISKRLKMTTVTKVVIEDGVKGLRVWRV